MSTPSVRLLVAVASLATGACATLLGLAPQTLEITSDPPGAHVFVAGVDSGVTPLRLEMWRQGRTPLALHLALEGRDTAFVSLTSHVRKEFLAWDILYLGLAPLGAGISDSRTGPPSIAAVTVVALAPVTVDFATGRIWALDSASVHVVLRPAAKPPSPP